MRFGHVAVVMRRRRRCSSRNRRSTPAGKEVAALAGKARRHSQVCPGMFAPIMRRAYYVGYRTLCGVMTLGARAGYHAVCGLSYCTVVHKVR